MPPILIENILALYKPLPIVSDEVLDGSVIEAKPLVKLFKSSILQLDQ